MASDRDRQHEPHEDGEAHGGAEPGGHHRPGWTAEWYGGELDFEEFLHLIPDAVVVVDASGKIVLANQQAERMFGYPREELIGEQVERLVPERYKGAHHDHRQQYMQDPQTRPMGIGLDLAGRRKDGSEFPADISLSAIHTHEGLLAAAAVRDLTERVEAERERKLLEAQAREVREHQARRLESIGELAGGIAHDFNNLLAVILNNAELALNDIAEGSELEESLREVYSAAEHASRLTRQLLIFSRREATPREAVDLNEVIRDMQRLLTRSLGERIEIEVRLAEGLPPVMASPSHLEQVILNLAINARDAMPSGGRLGIETTRVELDKEYVRSRPDVAPGDYVRLTVADDGVGMPKNVAARAFEPFYTTKETGQGSGLGLATVYGIVKQSEGHVAIYSEEGRGTVVRVHLQVASDAGEGQPAGEEQGPGGELHDTGHTVLVVEDAESVRRTVRRILERGGYRVIDTDRGSEALNVVSDGQERIDLVISDLVMPGMMGNELAEHLRKVRPGLPVLFMSGYADVTSPLEDDVTLIEKPFTSTRLLERVEEALGDVPPSE